MSDKNEERAERVAEIAARLRRASVGPWTLDERFPNMVYCDDELGSRVADCNASHAMLLRDETMADNATFIANAPQDIAWLLEALDSALGRPVSSRFSAA